MDHSQPPIRRLSPAFIFRSRESGATLSIPVEARHTWSPTVDVQVGESDGGTRVHALMGPEPTVWTMFLFLYAATAFPALIGTMVGMVQYNIGQSGVALFALPAGIVAWLLIYAASFVGRRLGADQIHQMLAVLEANLSVDASEID